MIEKQNKKIEIFYCYAHEDQRMVEDLKKQIFILQNQKLNIKLSYREVTGRKEWGQILDHNILKADIILPLLSADFMASNYLRSKDMEIAFDRLMKEQTYIIPIYLRPVEYANSVIEDLKFLPQNNKPVTTWKNRDEAFVDILQGIKRIIEEIDSKHSKELINQSNNITPHNVQNDKILGDTILPTNTSELPLMHDVQETVRTFEPISPATERSSYLFDQDVEILKKKAKRSKSNKAPSPFDQILPFFDTIASSTRQEQIPNTTPISGYEDARIKAQRKLTDDQPQEALDIIENVDIGSVPSKQRWRLAALRGHCYFGLGKFLPARREYNNALQVKPIIVPKEMLQEEGMLYLRAAETSRELGNLSEAVDFYNTALAHMNTYTQVGYLAEAHWGLALTLFEQIHTDFSNHTELNARQKSLLQDAFHHAESAKQLYHISGDALNVASITCDLALFEQSTGNLENASTHLKNILETWSPMLQQKIGNTKESHKRLREYNSIISAASCCLAGVEAKMHQYESALQNIKIAQETAEKSYTIRRGQAAMMLGVVLEERHLNDPNIEKAFQKAIDIFSSTELLGAQIHSHDLLGRYFFKVGKRERGEEELNKARKISQTAMFS